MANDGSHPGGITKHARASDPLRKHREEKVGSELSIHGALRIRRNLVVLGDMGLQDVVR